MKVDGIRRNTVHRDGLAPASEREENARNAASLRYLWGYVLRSPDIGIWIPAWIPVRFILNEVGCVVCQSLILEHCLDESVCHVHSRCKYVSVGLRRV